MYRYYICIERERERCNMYVALYLQHKMRIEYETKYRKTI